MKRAVSISIGSSKRNKEAEIEILGEKIHIERIGTDGDVEKAARMYQDLDGKVEAFGVGGAVLGLMLEDQWYTLHSVQSMVRFVKETPVVDGTALKMSLEAQAADVVEMIWDDSQPRTALLMSGVDRYGLSRCFLDAGYESVIGDIMFTLGVPVAIHTDRSLKRLARMLIPVLGRLPFHWLYPTGEKQEERTPKFINHFDWATVIAGDCHYITHYMPDKLENKIIVTNTTTESDRELFKSAGVKQLITTTPMYNGRTFGTNMLEAALVAASGRTEAVDYANPGSYLADISQLVDQLDLSPKAQEL
jgi:hypothetical protein